MVHVKLAKVVFCYPLFMVVLAMVFVMSAVVSGLLLVTNRSTVAATLMLGCWARYRMNAYVKATHKLVDRARLQKESVAREVTPREDSACGSHVGQLSVDLDARFNTPALVLSVRCQRRCALIAPDRLLVLLDRARAALPRRELPSQHKCSHNVCSVLVWSGSHDT